VFPATLSPLFVPTAQAGADSWSQGVSGAQQKYVDGVQGTNVDVVGRAIASQAAALANYQNAINSGLWARRLSEVGTAGWKSATVAKAANYGVGATAGKSKYLAAAQQLYPYIAAGQSQVDSMPSGTIAASKARAAFWIDYMYAYRASH
jgi:hypothetical protein